MTVTVDVSHLEDSSEINALIVHAAKNCRGFVGAFYCEHSFEDGFVYAHFYFKTQEDAVMFNLMHR